MELFKRLLIGVAKGAAVEASKVATEAVQRAQETEAGRDAIQNVVVGAGVVHVAGAKTPREALDRLGAVVDTARRWRGDR